MVAEEGADVCGQALVESGKAIERAIKQTKPRILEEEKNIAVTQLLKIEVPAVGRDLHRASRKENYEARR